MFVDNIKTGNIPEKEVFENLLRDIESVLEENTPLLSNLSNFIALIKDSFPKISWIGYYFAKDDILYLGPFQGKVACTKIKIGNGVCGTSAKQRKTVVVEDVHRFPGHIACDSGSNSEIVLPIIQNSELIGVLDLDSYQYSAFNDTDKKYLEKLIKLLVDKVDFKNFIV